LAGVPFGGRLGWRFTLGFDAEAGSSSDFTLPENAQIPASKDGQKKRCNFHFKFFASARPSN